MKKYLFLIMAWICQMSVLAQTPGYDPGNPPDPQMPETDTLWTVTLKSIPAKVGSLSWETREYKAGDNVSFSASDNAGCIFDEWKNADGTTLTTSRSYSMKMPHENVTFYACYHYDPTNPDNPVMPAMKYQLDIDCQPVVGATFNFTSGKVTEGTVQSLYCYPNPGFIFDCWKDQNGNVLSMASRLDFLMPSEDTHLTAHLHYDPTDPPQPGPNYWDPLAGDAIVDYFEPDYLYSTLDNLVGGNDNHGKVTHLTVDGIMSDNDWNFVYYFRNITNLDMSRVTGIKNVPSYRFEDYGALMEIELPACLEKIEYMAFHNCSMLQAIDCYATVPPVVNGSAFEGVPADMIVYVPEASVDLYKEADVWKDYTVVPLRSKLCKLEVCLPADVAPGQYKDHTLEALNAKTGQRLRYIVTDRLSYIFPTMIRDTKWNITLKSLNGNVVGEMQGVEMDDENKSVTFPSLKQKQSLSVVVKGANAADITADCQISLLNAAGKEMRGDLYEGDAVMVHVVLPEKDEVLYYPLQDVTAVIEEGNNTLTIEAVEIPKMDFTGTVTSSLTKEPVADANVTLKQSVAYQGINTYNVRTDKNGKFSFRKFLCDSHFVISADNYVNQERDYTEEELQKETTCDFELKPITGAVVDLEISYQKSVLEGEEPEEVSIAGMLDDLKFSLLNKNVGQSVGSYSVQYPSIVILDETKPGDEIELTCSSYSGSFKPVTVSGVIDEDNHVKLAFKIVEPGAAFVRFIVTDNPSVRALLYDAAGKLVKSELYSTMFTTVESSLGDLLVIDNHPNFVLLEGLADGNYTLVTMGNSSFFKAVSTLSDLNAAGLEAGVDYVKTEITSVSGRIEAHRIVVVPFFDESKFYFTGENTQVSINKASTIQGNYLTLSARVDFRPEYRESVSDVNLIFKLPETCDLVEGSVIVGSSLSTYEYNAAEHTLTVPAATDYTQRVKFCIVPQERGNYSPDAAVSFKMGEAEIFQPIGSVAYTVTDVTLWTPEMISLPYLYMDGNAPAQSKIDVYDDQTLIGTTTALNNGFWNLQADLGSPYNLSIHRIHAHVTAPTGFETDTETRFVEYNEDCIQAKNVEMTFFNNWADKTVWVNFDLEHVTTSSPSYMFEGNSDFVFTANLTNNSPEKVRSCVIRVFTINHEWIDMPARYIENLDRWVAYRSFDMTTAPIGVRVEVDAPTSEAVDCDFFSSLGSELKDAVIKLSGEEDGSSHMTFYNNDGTVHEMTVHTIEAPEADKYTSVDTLQTTCGDQTLLLYTADDGSYLLYSPSDHKAIDVAVFHQQIINAPQQNAPIATQIVTELKQHISELEQGAIKVANKINELTAAIDAQIQGIDYNLPFADPADLPDLYAQRKALVEKRVAVLGYNRIVKNINTLITYAHYGIRDINEWKAFADNLLPCDGPDDAQARAYYWIAEQQIVALGKRYNAVVNIAETGSVFAQYLLDNTTLENAFAIGDAALGYVMTNYSTLVYQQTKAWSRNLLNNLKAGRNQLHCNYATEETLKDNWDFSLPYPVVEPIIDPSGYVYEAVASNRLEGVTATAYYKTRYEDMYGDLHEDIVLWDATQYGQENPLLTDEQGMYQWDVPQGLWQVKFEKDGYQTAYSEWLPVPPPQMDVNIGLVQQAQPEVQRARAFESGVEIQFSKYMKPASLTADNIYIRAIRAGVEEYLHDINIELLDAESETGAEEDTKIFASRVMITADGLAGCDEAYLIVATGVESYNGLHMSSVFEQALDIEPQITELLVGETLTVGYGQQAELLIAALPGVAAAGRQVVVTSAQTLIATVGAEGLVSDTLTFDADGQALVPVHGALNGSTVLRVKVVGEEFAANVQVNVVDPAMLAEVEAPAASRLSGTAVFRGQTVTLSTPTEGAKIYYTLDGSCPCESLDRIEYTQPIVINGEMTLKAMAVGITGRESEISEFHYTIRQSVVNAAVGAGWNWLSHDVAEAVPAATFASVAQEIVTAEGQATIDAAGNLSALLSDVEATTAVKVKAATPAVLSFQGEEFNTAANVISLHSGLNWLGYPVPVTLAVGDALGFLNASEGDVIANLNDGFSVFSNGSWIGTLGVMNPGQGYQYHAQAPASFVYGTTSTVGNAAALGHSLQADAPYWNARPSDYPDEMCVIATLFDTEASADSADYEVAAFAGDVCRGVAQYVEGRFFLPVYGQEAEQITFRVHSLHNGDDYTADETVTFSSSVCGTMSQPLELHVIGYNGIGIVTIDNHATGNIYNLQGQKVDASQARSGLFIINGRKVLR